MSSVKYSSPLLQMPEKAQLHSDGERQTYPGLKVYILNFVLSPRSCSGLGSEGHVGLVLNVREAELSDSRQEDDL